MASLGGAQAIRESGNTTMLSFGGAGTSAAIALIRQGLMSAVTGGRDTGWMGWGSIDNLNRAFNGQPAVPQGIGFTLVYKAHNLPATDDKDWQSSIDYKAAYLKSWGFRS
jgi:ribose transport system substrate-binding protein